MNLDLSQLRDVHAPAPIPGWPIAPGWWLLLVAAGGLVALGIGLYRWVRRNRWRRAALRELRALRGAPADRLVVELSVLLRRVALARFSRQDVASLTGNGWLAFLDGAMPEGAPFQRGVGQILAVGPYAPRIEAETDALLALCERWIKRLPGARS